MQKTTLYFSYFQYYLRNLKFSPNFLRNPKFSPKSWRRSPPGRRTLLHYGGNVVQMTWNAGKRREFFLRHKTGWKWLDFFRIEFLHPVRHNFSPVGGMPAGAGNNPGFHRIFLDFTSMQNLFYVCKIF